MRGPCGVTATHVQRLLADTSQTRIIFSGGGGDVGFRSHAASVAAHRRRKRMMTKTMRDSLSMASVVVLVLVLVLVLAVQGC